jgi:hypothetical protein
MEHPANRADDDKVMATLNAYFAEKRRDSEQEAAAKPEPASPE